MRTEPVTTVLTLLATQLLDKQSISLVVLWLQKTLYPISIERQRKNFTIINLYKSLVTVEN